LLEYLLTDTLSRFDEQRLATSTTLLCNDLLRQGDGGFSYKTGVRSAVKGIGDVAIPILATAKDGRRYAISLSSPLTTGHPVDPLLKEVCEKTGDTLIVINELVVRGNLPAATREVQQRLGGPS
jgi:hypothetical protein